MRLGALGRVGDAFLSILASSGSTYRGNRCGWEHLDASESRAAIGGSGKRRADSRDRTERWTDCKHGDSGVGYRGERDAVVRRRQRGRGGGGRCGGAWTYVGARGGGLKKNHPHPHPK